MILFLYVTAETNWTGNATKGPGALMLAGVPRYPRLSSAESLWKRESKQRGSRLDRQPCEGGVGGDHG